MPRSAISSGLADFILSPTEMATHLIAYCLNAFTKIAAPFPMPTSKADVLLKKIFILLRAHTGLDFSLYKQNTIYRRVERRMAAHQFTELSHYTRYLQHNPLDVEALFLDLITFAHN